MSNKNIDKDLIHALAGKGFHVDSLGRIVIDDEELMNLVNGAYGAGLAEMSDSLWNGACSNSRC